MEAEYRSKVVKLVLSLLVENDWTMSTVPVAEAVDMLSMFPAAVVRHTLLSLMDKTADVDIDEVSAFVGSVGLSVPALVVECMRRSVSHQSVLAVSV